MPVAGSRVGRPRRRGRGRMSGAAVPQPGGEGLSAIVVSGGSPRCLWLASLPPLSFLEPA